MPKEIDLRLLDVGQLAFFVGQGMNDVVLRRLHASGFVGIRQSHGYVVQHLIGGDRSVTELAELLGLTQQAASKAVGELAELGYVEVVAGRDARVRRVRLSARGRSMLESTRKLRRAVERRLLRKASQQTVARARILLIRMLTLLGGADAVRRRRVRPPG
jgi:DNA-binding MarR family transcriptional regulator